MMKKHDSRQMKLIGVLMAVLLLLGTAAGLPAAEDSFAQPQVQEDSVVLSNEEGQELQVNVEEDLSAEEIASDESLSGAATLEDQSVPLAGFDPAVVNGDKDGDIHLGWMIALLLVVLAYIAYFVRYQNRILDLRRRIAAAEFKLRKGGK